MRYVLENVEAGNVSREIERKGISARQRVRVTLDTLEDDLPLAQMAEAGRAFEFLKDEPDLYSEADIKQQNV
jgi:hypothetical protein